MTATSAFGLSVKIRSSRGDYRVVETGRDELFQGLHAVVTDANVASAVGPITIPHMILPPGEETKSLQRYGEVLTWMAEAGLHRNSIIGALGGGVIGDLVGFAAASYMRGIRYVQIPTSLLAMVDSSVGGKVAVDLPAGKNLAGAFHPPIQVRVDLSTLRTLPPRELAAGMAEVIKTFAIPDATAFQRLGDEVDIKSVPIVLADLVRACIEFKSRIVEQDEDETTGLRAILNFGHTIGHALEATAGYSRYLHGEAVAIGMIAEARLGTRIGVTDGRAEASLRSVLAHHGLPTKLPTDLAIDDLIRAMRRDKKARDGHLNFALLREIGSARLVENVEESVVREVLRG